MSPANIGFVMEQTLGHRTHSDNLRSIVGADPRVEATWLPIAWERHASTAAVPGYGNWTVRSGVRARRAVAAAHRRAAIDALFVHTQVPATLMGRWLRRLPTVVSLDATPLQYDHLGQSYDHASGSAALEQLKWRAHRRCFERAAALVTWSDWAKEGLVEQYGVPPNKVHVIPPGVRLDRWSPGPDEIRPGGRCRLLFVGGDLERKGGHLLLEALRTLRAEAPLDGPEVVLDLVTQSPIEPEPGVTVHRGLGPNATELVELYRRADIFCLPTSGDCLPMVLSEAAACGLPMVSTDVGAISELVREGETGLLIPPSDSEALVRALRALVADADLRRRLGRNGLALVNRRYDAEANAARLVTLLVAEAEGRRRPGGVPERLAARTAVQMTGAEP